VLAAAFAGVDEIEERLALGLGGGRRGLEGVGIGFDA
jgi:hypothetical protein